MTYGYGHHAIGFTSEGSVTEDRLYDNFKVRRTVTIPAGNGPLIRGTAMGKITSSGKWKKSISAVNDGSQDIRGILLHDVDATSADVEAIVGRIGSCTPAAVIFGAGHTAASADDDCLDRGLVFERVIG